MKTLTKLAIPIMASSFLGTLYNITDMAWIGRLGSKAVAGVGVGGMYIWLSQGLASMARMGGQVQVAQCIGRGDREAARGYAQTAVQLATVLGLAFSAICVIFLHPLVDFFKLTDPEALEAAFSYTLVACGLLVFSFLTLTLTGLYTAQGDSKTPFVANFIGLVTNMILDPVLILGPGPFPKLGAVGAAIATVTAQFIVMGIMILGVVLRQNGNVLKGMRLFAKPQVEYVSGICKIGIPTALQGMAYCAISMVLTRMVSAFGCGCRGSTAGGRPDRIRLLEHSGRLWSGPECLHRAELRRRQNGSGEKGLPGFPLDRGSLGCPDYPDFCAAAGAYRENLFL